MFDLLQTYTALYKRKELEKEYSDLVASEKPRNVISSYWTLGVLGIIGLIFIVLVLGSEFFQTISTTSLLGSIFYAIGYIICNSTYCISTNLICSRYTCKTLKLYFWTVYSKNYSTSIKIK